MSIRHLLKAVLSGRGHNWTIGIIAGIVALVALVVGSQDGDIHGKLFTTRLTAWVAAGLVLGAGVLASARLAEATSRVTALRALPTAGSAVRVVVAGVGYLIALFAVLTVLEVSVERLIVGAGLAGVVLGIAAQQSLGNVFAGLVLLFARPFALGDRVRIRSGSLGGLFDATIQEMSLTYVTLRTPEGPLKIPNSVMLAAGVYQLAPGAAPLPPLMAPAAPPAPAPPGPAPSPPVTDGSSLRPPPVPAAARRHRSSDEDPRDED